MNLPWIRRIAIVLATLVVLLAVAAAVLVATFDANRYKSVAIDWMKQQRQRTLAIDGPIELSVWPRLALKVSKVRLSERGRDDEFMAVDEAALALQWLPLLSKQVVIDRVSARGVRAAYTRNAKGVSNISDLLAADSAAAGAAGAGSGAALQLAVSAVQLYDVQLRLRDEVSKLDGQISLHSFTSGRLADRTEAPLALRASLDLARPLPAKFTLEGRMRLTGPCRPSSRSKAACA